MPASSPPLSHRHEKRSLIIITTHNPYKIMVVLELLKPP